MEAKAGLRIAYSNQKTLPKKIKELLCKVPKKVKNMNVCLGAITFSIVVGSQKPASSSSMFALILMGRIKR